MKKIFQVVDTYGWAIDHLASGVVKASPHFDWRRMALHPKDLEQNKIDLTDVIESIKWADVVDLQYWRCASQLFEKIPEVLKDKVVIVTHHNEKNILSHPWADNVVHVVETEYSKKLVQENYPHAKVFLAPVCFDNNTFHYNTEYPPQEKAVGYVGRVVPWKGLKEVAQACFELGYPLMVMGKIDKPSYLAEIPEEHRNNIDWSYLNCEDSERPDFYKNITVYVGNSGGGRETGPLGVIEAMATGVPVISTPVGIVADIGVDDENMLLLDFDDVDGMKEKLSTVMESPAVQQRLRKAAWNTIRGYNNERRGYDVRRFMTSLLHEKPLVSVVIPTTIDKSIQTKQILDALEKSTYRDIEAVVVFDHAKAIDKDFQDLNSLYSFPVKVLCVDKAEGYNLAVARNLGVVEADGDYIMFNDNRMCPDPTAIEEFLGVFDTRGGKDKVWLFGEKGGEKSTFVENFSMIRRQQFISGGMCNERITEYGGMSQELRSRFASQGFEFGYVPTARAVQLCKSTLSQQKRDGIISMKNLLHKLNLK